MTPIATVGIAGTGLIGAGWAARLLFRGFDVIAYDVSPAAEAKLKAQIATAWPSLEALLGKPEKTGHSSFTTDLKEMASKADFIHEAARSARTSRSGCSAISTPRRGPTSSSRPRPRASSPPISRANAGIRSG